MLWAKMVVMSISSVRAAYLENKFSYNGKERHPQAVEDDCRSKTLGRLLG